MGKKLLTLWVLNYPGTLVSQRSLDRPLYKANPLKVTALKEVHNYYVRWGKGLYITVSKMIPINPVFISWYTSTYHCNSQRDQSWLLKISWWGKGLYSISSCLKYLEKHHLILLLSQQVALLLYTVEVFFQVSIKKRSLSGFSIFSPTSFISNMQQYPTCGGTALWSVSWSIR